MSLAVLRHIESQFGEGTLIKGTSPADGQLGILTLNGPDARRVDLMTSVFGIPQRKIDQVVSRAIRVNGVSVIDPILLFQSKCHCLLELDQSQRQDEKHLRILCAVLPKHLEEALEDTIAGEATERAFINEVKLLQAVLKRAQIRRALESAGVNPAALIPVETLQSCGLEKLEAFARKSIG